MEKFNKVFFVIVLVWAVLASFWALRERNRFDNYKAELAKRGNNEQSVRDDITGAMELTATIDREFDGLEGELDTAIGITERSSVGFDRLGESIRGDLTTIGQLIERQRIINTSVEGLQGENQELKNLLKAIRGEIASRRRRISGDL